MLGTELRASRPDALRSVQGFADSRSIVATVKVVENAQTLALLSIAHLKPALRRTALRSIADEMSVYDIP